MALGDEQFILGDWVPAVGDVVGARQLNKGWPLGCVQNPATFMLSGGGQPASNRGWVAEVIQLIY